MSSTRRLASINAALRASPLLINGVSADDYKAKLTECKAALETAQHEHRAALREAEAALDGLDKKDLGEAKGMAKPPGGVDDVFSAVLVLLANAGGASDIACDKKGKPKDVSWKAAPCASLPKKPEISARLVMRPLPTCNRQ